jgi:hypothetical protein
LSELPQPRKEPIEIIGEAVKIFAVVSSGLTFILLLGVPTHTRGATRSTRLKWQERQQQVDQAVERDASHHPANQ